MKKAFNAMLLLSMLSMASVSAIAADPEGVTPENAGRAGEGEPAGGSIPNLDVNKAELQANEGLPIPLHPGLVERNQARNPMMDQIEAVIAAADIRLTEMKTRLDTEAGNADALELIKGMEQVKIQAELDILAVQAGHARATGRTDIAQEIEQAITEMTTPRPVRQPVERPAPAGASH